MQASSFELSHQALGGLPIIEQYFIKMRLPELLTQSMGSARYAVAILLLIKNILLERRALYAIHEWSVQFDPALVCGGAIGDDTIARALDRVYQSDRASLQTRIVLEAVQKFKIEVGQIHQDTTSVKLFGNYAYQLDKAVQLKHGHSKDHRPDLKQLVYELSVTRDGAVPVHFKAHDGNRTDDTLHWDNWLSLRGLFGKSDFLYVGDSKLCVEKTLRSIDSNQGRFVTIMPATRAESGDFADKVASANIRWERVFAKRSTRKFKRIDVFEVASGLYQMREGFRLYWFRSSEKKRRDEEDREEHIDHALDHLRALGDPGRKVARTEETLKRRALKILTEFGAKEWIHVETALERVEEFKQKTRGRANKETDYRRVEKWIPRLNARRNLDAIARSEAMDGVFPLATNTDMKAVEVLNAYKYQPKLEKRHALLKSGLNVAPVFLKKNDRIEALMFVYFMAQIVAALIERDIRLAMDKKKIEALAILPEERPSKHPTTEQVFRVFEHRARHVLYSKSGQAIQTFVDPLTRIQKQILGLLNIALSVYA